jgi:uncharacterized membrane protein YkvA (DUF1232 family)
MNLLERITPCQGGFFISEREGLQMSQVNESSEVEVISQVPERSLVIPVVFLVLAIFYDLSPIDIIPDIPVVGYFDDLIITAIATLNLLQKWFEDTSGILAAALGFMKWLVIFVGVIAVSLVGLIIWGIVKFFAI